MKENILIIDNILYRHKRFSVAASRILKEHLEEEGIKVNFCSTKVNRIIRLTDILTSILRYRHSSKAVLIYVYSGKAFLWAYLSANLCRLIKKPYLLYLHGGNLPFFIEGKERLLIEMGKRSLGVIAPSCFLKDKLQGKGIKIDRVIPNFIDFNKYTFKERTEISPKLFWLRAYHNIYNPQMAIKLLHQLKREYPQATLTMAGPDKGALRDVKLTAKNSGVYDSVGFLEFISKKEIDSLGFKHNIFINTAHLDNMPVTLLEAMAMGLAIVSTRVGGIPYFLEDGKDALLVPDNDYLAMAKAVKRLLREPELVKCLTANSKAKVEQFSWEGVRPLWQEVLNLGA